MYNASRERAFLLYNITFDADPANRVEKYGFLQLGATFGRRAQNCGSTIWCRLKKPLLEDQGIFTSVAMNLQQE